MTKWNYSNDILLFAIADPIWQSWSPADQKIVRECAQDAAKQQIALVRKLYAEDVERVRALGVDVHVPTPPEAGDVADRLPARRMPAGRRRQCRAGRARSSRWSSRSRKS